MCRERFRIGEQKHAATFAVGDLIDGCDHRANPFGARGDGENAQIVKSEPLGVLSRVSPGISPT